MNTLFFFKDSFIWLRERERSRGKESSSRLPAEHWAQHGDRSYNLWDHGLSQKQQSDLSNWATQVPQNTLNIGKYLLIFLQNIKIQLQLADYEDIWLTIFLKSLNHIILLNFIQIWNRKCMRWAQNIFVCQNTRMLSDIDGVLPKSHKLVWRVSHQWNVQLKHRKE